MTISEIQSGQNVCNNLFATNVAKSQKQQSVGNLLQPDTVEISDQARELAQQTQAERAKENIAIGQTNGDAAGKVLPVEAYSIPGWMGDFSPRHSQADIHVGQSYVGSNAELYDSLSPAEKEDLSEYMHTLHTFYMEEKGDRGINTTEDYYNAIVLNQQPGLSEELHQAVRQRLAESPRMMELMQEFGVTL